MRISNILLLILSFFMLFAVSTFTHVEAAPFIQLFPSAELFIFEGNNTLSQQTLMEAAPEELNAFALDKKNRAAIDDAAFQMELAYRMAGFPDARVDYVWNTEAANETVRFLIFEGKMTVVREMNISGNTFYEIETLLSLNKQFKDNTERKKSFPYVASEISKLCSDIQALYSKEGFLDTVVDKNIATTEDEEKRYFDISLSIIEGPRYQITSLSFQNEPLAEISGEIDILSKKFVGHPFFPRKNYRYELKLQSFTKRMGISMLLWTSQTLETGEQEKLNSLLQ